ncbi:MAG: Prolipoprotein diacylglyceryl transferase [Myxococcota bacterium]|nr:Prolipoprotein diacylglyceryl transferase [Myxococcota bacterium]
MHKVLLHLDIPLFGKIVPFTIYSYGFLVALGFILGIWICWRDTRRSGVDGDVFLDQAFYVVIGSMIAARVLFIIVEWKQYAALPWYYVFHPFYGGIVFYGGFLGSFIAVWLFVRGRKDVTYFQMGDFMSAGAPLGHFLGRLGCFAVGCCWGSPAAEDFPLAVRFPPDTSGGGPPGLVPLHPTQLYEALGNLAIFFVLMFIRARKRFHGQVLMGYMILYAVLRFVLEFWRGDTERGYLIENVLTTSQAVAILVAAMAALFWVFRLRRAVTMLPAPGN